MKETVSISVIIPCYKCGEEIDKAVDSVIAQTVEPREIIMVEDSSDDQNRTWNKLLSLEAKYGSIIKLIRHEYNQGTGPARNTGWNTAKGKYIALLDQDDIWHPQKLEIQYRFLENNASADFVGCSVKWLRKKDFPELPVITFNKLKKWRFLYKNPFFSSSVMIKKDIPLRFPDLAGVDDYYLWLNLICNKYSMYLCNAYLCFMLKPPFGASGQGANINFMHGKNEEAFERLKSEGIISFYEYSVLRLFEVLKIFSRKMRAVLYSKWKKQ